MLTMGSADDLTARARVRDAAVRLFGQDGFGVPLRAVAAQAGVSAALIVHHFGSKDGLRRVCDEHVLALVRESKAEAISPAGPGGLRAALAAVDDYAPAAAYVAQSLASGDGAARDFLEHMVDDARAYLAEGVANGTVRPSRDPDRRARFLVLSSTGMLLMHLRTSGDDVAQALHVLAAETTLPALELYTEGLLADPSFLDAYLASEQVPTPAGGAP